MFDGCPTADGYSSQNDEDETDLAISSLDHCEALGENFASRAGRGRLPMDYVPIESLAEVIK